VLFQFHDPKITILEKTTFLRGRKCIHHTFNILYFVNTYSNKSAM
jgi:hypothetical protein